MGRPRNPDDAWLPNRLYRGKSAYELRLRDGRTIRLCALNTPKDAVLAAYNALPFDDLAAPKPKLRAGNIRIYRAWSGIVQRCTNPKCHAYPDYGGRGITVCDEWLHDSDVFIQWSLDNGYADNLTIDRKDNSSGYHPDNCRWVDRTTQARNRRPQRPLTPEAKRERNAKFAATMAKKRATTG